MTEFDFVVVGSGIAGLSFALKAARHGRVALVTKRSAGESNTAWAQGGVCCVLAEDDSFDLHVADTLDAGAGLCNEEVVRAIVSAAPERMKELMDWGVKFDADPATGVLNLGREGGHTRRRILHHGDTTGREIAERLLERAREAEGITFFEHHFAIDLITSGKLGYATEDRCLGLYVLDEKSGEVLTFRSDRVILATGGCGRVYQFTTNPPGATGDGVADGMARGCDHCEHGVRPVSPHVPISSEARISSSAKPCAAKAACSSGRTVRSSCTSMMCGRVWHRATSWPGPSTARSRTGSPCMYLDMTSKPREFLQVALPDDLADMYGCGDRHRARPHSRGACRALSMRRRAHGHQRRDQLARPVCHW